MSCNFVFSQHTNNDFTAQTAAEGMTRIRIGMWANTPPNDVGHNYILDIAISIYVTLILDLPQQQQVFYLYKQKPKPLVYIDSKAWQA